jgi:hypothetical protein
MACQSIITSSTHRRFQYLFPYLDSYMGFDKLGPDVAVEHAVVDGFFDVMGFDIV